MLDALPRASNMLDEHFRKKDVNFNWIRIFKPSNDYSNILFVRLVVSFVLQNGFQNGGTVEQTKETIENGHKKWTDDEVQDLNELLKEKPCLWDMYTKWEVKERAYAELAEHFDSSSAIAKAKINFLRKQTWSRNGKRIKNKKWSGNRQKVR